MTSVWHPNKFEKILEKLSKNILSRGECHHQKSFQSESILLGYGLSKSWRDAMLLRARGTSFFFQFFLYIINYRKNISHTLRCISKDGG